MIELFVMLVEKELRTMEEVPEEIRESVRKIVLENAEKELEFPSVPVDYYYIDLGKRIDKIVEVVDVMLGFNKDDVVVEVPVEIPVEEETEEPELESDNPVIEDEPLPEEETGGAEE